MTFPSAFPNPFARVAEAADRVADNAALAEAQQSGGRMYVQPDKVDELAAFFTEEAENLRSRSADVFDLGLIEPPGTDGVSTQAAEKFGQVAIGGDASYQKSYNDLANYLRSVAENLHASSRQTRTNDQDSADSIKS